MRLLLTGNLGYIGTVLTPLLLAEGFDVVGMDSDLFERSTFGAPPVEIPTIRKDVRDAVQSDLDGFDAVLHLAGLSNDPLGDLNPELTYDINYRASVKLAKLAKAAGVGRFVFSSSCSTYGASGDDLLTEEAPFAPVTPYGKSKVLAEQEISPLADSSFTPVYLRNATAYGVSPRLRFDLVINNLVAWAYATGKVHLKSDGTPWRPIVHVEDISRAFIAAVRAPRELVHNEAINIGSTSENYRISELAAIVKATVPGSETEFDKDAGPDKRCYRVDCGKAARCFPGFKTHWTAKAGAEQLYSLYKKVGLQLDEFEGPRYRRLDHLKALIAAGEVDQDLRRSANGNSDRDIFAAALASR